MVQIARLTDYGLILMTHMAATPSRPLFACKDLAEETRIPLPTVSKVMKTLAKAGLLASHRGVAGGYSLARPADEITVADIISALEGPIALTLCSHHSGECGLEASCPTRDNWLIINNAIRSALEGITLARMATPMQGPLLTIGGLPATPNPQRRI